MVDIQHVELMRACASPCMHTCTLQLHAEPHVPHHQAMLWYLHVPRSCWLQQMVRAGCRSCLLELAVPALLQNWSQAPR